MRPTAAVRSSQASITLALQKQPWVHLKPTMARSCASLAVGFLAGALLSALLFGHAAEEHVRVVSNNGGRPEPLRSGASHSGASHSGASHSGDAHSGASHAQLALQLQEALAENRRVSEALRQSSPMHSPPLPSSTMPQSRPLHRRSAIPDLSKSLSGNLSESGNNLSEGESELLSAHRHWDWRSIVNDMMQRWPGELLHAPDSPPPAIRHTAFCAHVTFDRARMPHLILRTFHTTFCVHVPHRILRHMPHAGSPSMPFLGGGHTTPGLEPATPFPPGRTTPPVYRRSFFFFSQGSSVSNLRRRWAPATTMAPCTASACKSTRALST